MVRASFAVESFGRRRADLNLLERAHNAYIHFGGRPRQRDGSEGEDTPVHLGENELKECTCDRCSRIFRSPAAPMCLLISTDGHDSKEIAVWNFPSPRQDESCQLYNYAKLALDLNERSVARALFRECSRELVASSAPYGATAAELDSMPRPEYRNLARYARELESEDPLPPASPVARLNETLQPVWKVASPMLKLAGNVKPAIAAVTAVGGFVMALPGHAETFMKEHPTLLLVLIGLLVALLVALGSVRSILRMSRRRRAQ